MTQEELRQLIQGRKNDEFVDTELLNRRPWIFADDAEHDRWRKSVADVLNASARHICIVGSAATGYSLSPLKAGRSFRDLTNSRASDIDLAIVNEPLFEEAWNTIVALDRRIALRLPAPERDKMRTDVYWGLVAQRALPGNTDTARRLLLATARAGIAPPIRGYQIRCRIYRREEDLRAYHIVSLRSLRAELSI
jgi:hypothetical protein